MPELTVTETQLEALEEIQSDLAAAYIDTYGHIRLTDAVQYLLDTYTPPETDTGGVAHERIATAEFQALQAVAADVEGVPGSGIDAETMRGELLSTLGVAEFAARLAALDGAERSDAAADAADTDADAAAETTAASGDSSASATASDTDEGSGADTATESDDAADESSGAASSGPPGGPGSVLSAANKLLTDHEDKWREGGSDEPYEVDLPDGTTEKVRTKDDVRGLLFKHY